ncbi:MAG TPA: Ig-like domain-containing protein, partial [Verrucomicrobiae bacterium]|nr:Ig-like domain-containing protein [Verrucomicrobiae bacterium]
MNRAFKLLLLACALTAPRLLGEPSTSENYSTITSIDGGGGLVTSENYEQNVFIAPVSGRSVAIQSDVMVIGFASQLNNAPTAQDDVRSHPFGSPVTLTASSLLSNDFDPESDPLSFVSVSAQSQRGGTLSVLGPNITYTPPQGLTDYDQFTYTVSDANGDISSATVVLGIAPPIGNLPLNNVSVVEQPDGQYLIRFRTATGRTDYS